MKKLLLFVSLLLPSICIGQTAKVVNITGPNVTGVMNFSTANGDAIFNVTLIGTVSTSTIDVGALGTHADFIICQDAVGGRTFVWPPNITNPPIVSATANACTSASFGNVGGGNWKLISNNGNAGASNSVIISTSCGANPNCFTVAANTRWTADGSITNTLPTVSSATINFQATDIGRSIYTVNITTGLTKLIGTILSVQSATQATASANATATEVGDTLCVGTDDTAQLLAAWNYAVSKGGYSISLPVGAMLVSGQTFSFTGTPNPSGSYSVLGQGGYGSGTVFVMAPNYNFAGMTDTHGMLYSYNPAATSDTPSGFHQWPNTGNFSVTGLGSVFSGAAPIPTAVISSLAGVIKDFQVAGFGGLNNMAGISMSGSEGRIYNADIQPNFSTIGSNMPAILVNNASYIDIYSPITAYTQGFGIEIFGCQHCNVYGGIVVSAGASPGGNPHASVYINNSQDVRFFGGRINGGPTGGTEPADFFVDATSTAEIYGMRFENPTTGSNGIWVLAGGKLHLHDIDMSPVTGLATGIQNNGTIYDECGIISAASSTPYAGTGVLYGSCSTTGVAAVSGNTRRTALRPPETLPRLSRSAGYKKQNAGKP